MTASQQDPTREKHMPHTATQTQQENSPFLAILIQAAKTELYFELAIVRLVVGCGIRKCVLVLSKNSSRFGVRWVFLLDAVSRLKECCKA